MRRIEKALATLRNLESAGRAAAPGGHPLRSRMSGEA
jgi:hypothetical protein